MSLYRILPNQLLTKEGLKPTKEVLKEKTKVVFFYAADWCGFCREFEPILTRFYDKTHDMYLGDCGYEVIFVSRDKNEYSFNEHYKNMHWTAVKFDDVSKIFDFYKPKTIPSLVVVDIDTSEIIDTNARNIIPNVNLNDSIAVNNVLKSWCGCD